VSQRNGLWLKSSFFTKPSAARKTGESAPVHDRERQDTEIEVIGNPARLAELDVSSAD
jgi:hypothetical protein